MTRDLEGHNTHFAPTAEEQSLTRTVSALLVLVIGIGGKLQKREVLSGRTLMQSITMVGALKNAFGCLLAPGCTTDRNLPVFSRVFQTDSYHRLYSRRTPRALFQHLFPLAQSTPAILVKPQEDPWDVTQSKH